VIADGTAYDVRFTGEYKSVSVTILRKAGRHDPIQRGIYFMNAPKLYLLKRDH